KSSTTGVPKKRILSANGRFTTSLPRKGILMAIKFTRPRYISTREIPAPSDPCDGFLKAVEECVKRFRGEAVTPQSAVDLENTLAAVAMEACRQILERELN